MKLNRLRALVEHAINTASVTADFEEGGLRLSIRALPAAAGSAIRLDPEGQGPSTIHSSLFGLFHRQEGGAAAPFVSIGQDIQAGQKIGLIEAMKVFSPVIAHRAGRIIAVLAEHGAEVECGQPLFRME